jgi:tetratricopeptide (TPR) repeat protein
LFEVPSDEAAPRSSLFGPAFYLAIGGTVVLMGVLLAAVVVVVGQRERTPVVEKKREPAPDDLAGERSKLDSARMELENARRDLERSKWLARAETAQVAGKWAEVEAAYQEVLKLDPADAEALKGLAEVKARREVADKALKGDKGREQEREKLVADARVASKAGKYAEAVRLLEEAQRLSPAEASVREALADARAALENDAAQKKTLADYNARVVAGKNALEAGRFADAAREFTAALVLMPDGAEAKDGQKAAEGKLAAVADREKADRAVRDIVTAAKADLAATRFNQAIAQLEQALRLVPGDREVTRLLANAKAERDKVKAANARKVAAANNAANNNQPDEALRLAQEAARAWAEDQAALRLVRRLEVVIDGVRTAADAYQRAVTAGTLAMADRRFVDAVAAYSEALRLNPGSVEVAAQLRNARIAADNLARARVEYERLVRLGTLALSRNAWAEAIKQFGEAERLIPEDLAAREGINRARYGEAMQQGQQALTARKKAEAIAAFEQALTIRPGDVLAQRGLLQARMLRGG